MAGSAVSRARGDVSVGHSEAGAPTLPAERARDFALECLANGWKIGSADFLRELGAVIDHAETSAVRRAMGVAAMHDKRKRR